MSESYVLEARNISVFASRETLLENVSLAVPDAAISVLAGPVGAGKSVLVRVLGGLVTPHDGVLCGAARGRCGVVLQDAAAHLLGATVEEDIHLSLDKRRYSDTDRARRTREVLSACGIYHLASRAIQHLSSGEARLCALAATMAASPRLLICDEPFANLDWNGVDRVLRALLSYTRDGGAVLAVTHETEKLLAHAKRLFVLEPRGPIHTFSLPQDLRAASTRSQVEAYGLRMRGPVEKMSWLKNEDSVQAPVRFASG